MNKKRIGGVKILFLTLAGSYYLAPLSLSLSHSLSVRITCTKIFDVHQYPNTNVKKHTHDNNTLTPHSLSKCAEQRCRGPLTHSHTHTLTHTH